ncbi:MAG TPA: hypothetical protein VN695_01920, partial [Streptosporangiaceae bacterium]|nr:hypothetical protein [Streptosporangiaceae bacterium]
MRQLVHSSAAGARYEQEQMGQDERRFDSQAARVGLALLQIQARASDPKSQPGWVNRRVQQI